MPVWSKMGAKKGKRYDSTGVHYPRVQTCRWKDLLIFDHSAEPPKAPGALRSAFAIIIQSDSQLAGTSRKFVNLFGIILTQTQDAQQKKNSNCVFFK